VNLAAVKLEEVGEYEFAITYQGEELTYLPLLAQLDTSTPTIEATPWDTQLRLGYEVFQRGQAEPARKVFEEFTRSFPSIPDGWNNLGFVQLDMGLARQAETSFERARDLGYLKPEIMSMNLGCAYYAQERFDEAVTAFREALGAGRFAGPAILHAITQAGLHSVDVPDVRAFIGLGLVNESWTEFRLGEFRLSRSSVDAAIQLASDAATELPRWLKEAAEDLSDLIERSSNPE
jgi:tetratricopeptide (TPR) repeat protein